jgi:hypothetical protein
MQLHRRLPSAFPSALALSHPRVLVIALRLSGCGMGRNSKVEKRDEGSTGSFERRLSEWTHS